MTTFYTIQSNGITHWFFTLDAAHDFYNKNEWYCTKPIAHNCIDEETIDLYSQYAMDEMEV